MVEWYCACVTMHKAKINSRKKLFTLPLYRHLEGGGALNVLKGLGIP